MDTYTKLVYELKSKQFVTSSLLCDKLFVNSRELKKIVDKFNAFDYELFHIESKTSKGYCLISELSILEINERLDTSIDISIEDKIELELLFACDYIKVDYIADKYFISYSKAYFEVNKLKDSYDIEMKKNVGYKLIIDDFVRKVSISEIISTYITSINVRRDLTIIFDSLGFDYSAYIERAISILNDERLRIKSSIYINTLILCILELNDDIDCDSIIETIFGCKLSSSSIEYWNNFLLNPSLEFHIDVDELIESINNQFDFKLKYSNNDYEQLKRHLAELGERIASASSMTGQNFEKINRDFEIKYPLASEIAMFAVSHISKIYNIDLPQIEKLYLAIHFQKLLSNANQKVKIIIVCEYGYAMSSLLANEIMMHLNDIEILCMKSLSDFQANINDYIHEVDIIVTTLNTIKLEDVKVITIPNYDTDQAIELIAETKNNIVHSRFQTQIMNTYLDLSIDVNDRSELYDYLTEYCISNNICDLEYFTSAIDRETKGNIVQNKIAYIHGDNSYVNTNCVLLVELNDEIEWLDRKVKYIFIIFATYDTLKTYGREISSLYKKTVKSEFITANNQRRIEILKEGKYGNHIRY